MCTWCSWCVGGGSLVCVASNILEAVVVMAVVARTRTRTSHRHRCRSVLVGAAVAIL